MVCDLVRLGLAYTHASLVADCHWKRDWVVGWDDRRHGDHDVCVLVVRWTEAKRRDFTNGHYEGPIDFYFQSFYT